MLSLKADNDGGREHLCHRFVDQNLLVQRNGELLIKCSAEKNGHVNMNVVKNCLDGGTYEDHRCSVFGSFCNMNTFRSGAQAKLPELEFSDTDFGQDETLDDSLFGKETTINGTERCPIIPFDASTPVKQHETVKERNRSTEGCICGSQVTGLSHNDTNDHDSGIAEDLSPKSDDSKEHSPYAVSLLNDFSSSSEEAVNLAGLYRNCDPQSDPQSDYSSSTSGEVETIEIFGARDAGFWYYSDPDDRSSSSSSIKADNLDLASASCSKETSVDSHGVLRFPFAKKTKSRRRHRNKELVRKLSEVDEDSSEDTLVLKKKLPQWKKRLRRNCKLRGFSTKCHPRDVEIHLDRWCSKEEKKRRVRMRDKDKRYLLERFCKKEALLARSSSRRDHSYSVSNSILA